MPCYYAFVVGVGILCEGLVYSHRLCAKDIRGNVTVVKLKAKDYVFSR